jgi:hypothetical protein
MPDRYWVGGTANWDGTAGAKWSATSGGPGGVSVPTTADDVFFTNLSTGTCTIATGNTGARSINCTGFTGTITGSANISVAGSVTLVAAMTYTHTGTVTFTGTGTLTTAGKTFGSVTVDGAGIALTQGDALNQSGSSNVTVTRGTFTTNNFNVTSGALLSSNTNTRTINLGSSTVSLNAVNNNLNFSTSTNLTFNAGTSLIRLISNTASFSGGGQTFYDVSFISTGSGNRSILGVNIFRNFTLAASSGAGITTFIFINNQTVNGTFTCAGSAPGARCFVRSEITGTACTITAAAISAADCDFRDITLAGAAAGAAPTRAGNCGGNSGITFPAAKTVYRVGTATTWAGVNSWATGSGGTGADTNFPLAQDTAVIDNSTTLTGTLSLGAIFNIGSLDASTRTTSITLDHNAAASRYGSYALGSGATLSGTSAQTFSGRGTMDFTSAGKTITFPITMDTIAGTLRLLDAVSISNSVTFTRGTLNLNNNTLTAVAFLSTSGDTRTLAFGTGNIAVTGTATVWNMAPANFTHTGTPVVNVTNSSATGTTVNAGSGTEANSINFNFTAGTYALTLSNGSTVQNLNFTGFSGNLNITLRTIFGNLTLSTGMTLTGGTSSTTFASTSGTPRTITTNGKTLDFPIDFNGVGGTWRLLDALTMGSARTLTHTNGTLDLNGFNLTVGTSGSYTTATGTKNLTFNGGTLTCPAASTTAFNNAAPTGFTTTAGTGTGTINMTAAGAKTFVGGGSTFNCTLNNGGAGALTITGGNTVTTLANSVQPTSFLFTAGTTTTLTNWNINGTAGNLVTIGSATAASHTLTKASGTVSADYLSISNSTATGGATWNAGANSVDGGNNSGWIFGAIVGIIASLAASEVGPDILAADAFIGYKVLAALSASEVGPDIFEAFATIGTPTPPVADAVYLIKLRSFTERRRF